MIPKVLDCAKSGMEFVYGLAEKGQKKCRRRVRVEKIFLEESWKFKIGQYRTYRQLFNDGKDIAILLLERKINEKEYPQLLQYNNNFNSDLLSNIQIYGYMKEVLRKSTGSVLQTSAGSVEPTPIVYQNGWGWFHTNAWCTRGKYNVVGRQLIKFYRFFFFELKICVVFFLK